MLESTRPTISQLDGQALQELRAGFRGALISPDDEQYDSARRVFNGMIDRYPLLIARCANAGDVIRAVNFARDHGLTLAVRGGGHNGGGLGTCDGGLVIDLSAMKGVRVDPFARTARVEGGATWGDVDHATHAFGLATPSGIISTTGVGGLTLGGGMGHLSRKCGLSIDNLLSADVVLADGRLVHASAQENPDLFWAMRGGGGNFGVVTSFEFRLHPISTVMLGITFWEMEHAKKVMQWYREFMPAQPDDVNGFFAFLVVPPAPPFPEQIHLKNVCGIVWCYTGPQ
ncbi:MAG TPA: FAD-binding oxidoreductase, partial [Caldilineaceae bacterium]|nr:FAD-binding oxidoreductase [Caldilineaceae bacterium]